MYVSVRCYLNCCLTVPRADVPDKAAFGNSRGKKVEQLRRVRWAVPGIEGSLLREQV